MPTEGGWLPSSECVPHGRVSSSRLCFLLRRAAGRPLEGSGPHPCLACVPFSWTPSCIPAPHLLGVTWSLPFGTRPCNKVIDALMGWIPWPFVELVSPARTACPEEGRGWGRTTEVPSPGSGAQTPGRAVAILASVRTSDGKVRLRVLRSVHPGRFWSWDSKGQRLF